MSVCFRTAKSGNPTRVTDVYDLSLFVHSTTTSKTSIDESNQELSAKMASIQRNAEGILLWRPFGFLHTRFNTPVLSILLTSGMAVVCLLIFKNFETLTAVFGWCAWVFQFCIFLALILMRWYWIWGVWGWCVGKRNTKNLSCNAISYTQNRKF